MKVDSAAAAPGGGGAKSGARVTALLEEWRRGDPRAGEEALASLYGELRRIAAAHFRRERTGHTLQPTALVHEAYLRLAAAGGGWQSRAHFLATASRVMRRLLVNHARDRGRARRGGGALHVTLGESAAAAGARPLELLALERALERLVAVDPLKARLVELRFYGGLTVEETAEVLGLATATVGRHWRRAKAWLLADLGGSGEPGD
jgi:RNA polymerase sigma factor (TIGR02999 family)